MAVPIIAHPGHDRWFHWHGRKILVRVDPWEEICNKIDRDEDRPDAGSIRTFLKPSSRLSSGDCLCDRVCLSCLDESVSARLASSILLLRESFFEVDLLEVLRRPGFSDRSSHIN